MVFYKAVPLFAVPILFPNSQTVAWSIITAWQRLHTARTFREIR